MYIKTITIQGFKSYRDQVAVDPFSSGHNVIVGRNGSGKSNFFSAIRFVLSDQYTSMTREDRQQLLHSGDNTTTTLSAFVEIVFDNTDGRFPTNLPEMRLRRTIGLKKDEYSLDKKSTTKAEVMNLLESAGFSRSNPYYIVPQGKIIRLTNMSDSERLNLLKEVAGTKVYEQKRAESTRIMEDTDSKRDTIADMLGKIEERLEELESEKEELKEYNEKDRERRCLEYSLHQKELIEVSTALDKIEDERRSDIHTSNEKQNEFNEREQVVQQREEALTTAKHALSTTQTALRQYETDMADLIRSRTEIECVIQDFKNAEESGQQLREEMSEELEDLEARIAETTENLDKLREELDERIAAEKEATEALDTTSSKLQVLYAKQGRAQQFTTQAQRDKFLNDEIKSLKVYEKTQQRRVEDLTKEVSGAKEQLGRVTARSEDHAQGEEQRREEIKKISEDVTSLKKNQDDMQEQRKNLWREDGKLSQTVQNVKNELDNMERRLAGMMDKDTSNGLRSVKVIAKRLGLDGVYGALYELFDVSDSYKTAVEVTAGTSLFHVVVDTDETAGRILEVMNKEKSGRVTFVPINRLRSQAVQYPKADDAVPLIKKLKYNADYQAAFEQVFARTIVCNDLAIAAQYTRSHGLNAVTLAGDRADRKGTLSGGYHERNRSRLDTVKGVKKWRESYETDSARHKEVKAGIAKIDQDLTAAMGQIQRLEARRKQLLESRSRQNAEASWTLRELENTQARVEKLEAALADAEKELRDAEAKRKADEEEIKTPMRQNLTAEEQRSLEKLTRESEEQKQAMVEVGKARRKAASDLSQLQIELSENLRRRRDELRGKLDELEADAGSGVLQAGEVDLRNTELRNLVQSIETLQESVQESEEKIDELNTEIQRINTELEEIRTEQLEFTRTMVRVQKNAERYLTKRQTLSHRKEECSNAIRDLGVLPEEAYSKYANADNDKLVKKLHKINEGLKKFAHVNKKAYEQYNNFTKQRDELLKRRGELDESAESIEELIQTLDQRKDEAIERTFKQVSKYFEEVFETLVPAGKGALVMQKKMDGYVDEESEAQNGANGQKSDIDNYTGVSIKVSFNSKADEGQRIQQLSGGQKTVVALATVFAIQKCDPAPFYLMDEIDANLDAQYRTAVASMIHNLSNSAQFITTTFRPEMLAEADKFYGVYFSKHRISSVHPIVKEQAYEFVESAAQVGQL